MPIKFLIFVSLSAYAILPSATHAQSGNNGLQYVCLPCGNDCDKDIFDKPGNCPHCNMKLVDKKTIRFHTIQPAELCGYIRKHPGVVLLDVRTPEEFAGKTDPDYGTLQNAVNVPVQELEARLASLSKYRNKDIIVYCSHSHRSPQAAYILNQNGFKKVTNMAGGMSVMTDRTCVK